MTVLHFNTLPEYERLNLVFTFGVDVAERTTTDYQITLFQLFSLYVEIYSSGEKMLVDILCFDDTDRLDIYIRDYDIESMINGNTC